MPEDKAGVLEVSKTELNFREMGGYSLGKWASLGPELVFEDSPTCINYDRTENSSPCSGCVLIHCVPPDRHSESIPCRHIQLNASGATLCSLYRSGDRRAVEEEVGNWLRSTMDRLENSGRLLHRDEQSSIKKLKHLQADVQVAEGRAG